MAIPQTLSLADSRRAYYEQVLTLPNSGLSNADLYSKWLTFTGAADGVSIQDKERTHFPGDYSVQDGKRITYDPDELTWLRAQP
jgi:hypothetical protein